MSDDRSEIYIKIKQSHYDNLQERVNRQIKKIKELETLKAELLDESQAMSSELRRLHAFHVYGSQQESNDVIEV